MIKTFTKTLALVASLIAGNLGAQIIYQENFTSSLNTCTASGGSNGNWVWTGSCAQSTTANHTGPGVATYSGSSCQFGNGSNTVAGDLTTPGIAIGSSGAVLTFKYFVANECQSPGNTCFYDVLTFQISNNGGTSWTNIMASNGTPAGLTQTNAWTLVTYTLNSYSNQTILIRFNFNSLDGIGNAYDGIYVDDIIVTGNCFISLVNAANQSTVSPVICAGNTLTLTTNAVSNYTWNTAANTQSIVVSPTVNTIYQVIATSSANCSTSNSIQVIVNPGIPTLAIANTATLGGGTCPNSTVMLTASGANTYTWNTSSPSVTNGAVFQPTTTATYTVQGSNACGTASAALSISIHPLPTVNGIASTSSLCSGNPVTLTGTGNATLYVWNGSVPNGQQIFPTATQVHTVIGTSALGCTAQAVVPVTVVTTPLAPPLPSPPLICIGSTATISSTGAASYTWTTPAGVQSGSLITVSPNATTTYTLSKSNANCVNTQTVQVIVNNLPPVSAFASPTLICASTTASLFGAGALTYTWNSNSTPALTLTGASPIVSPSVTTIYTLSASDGTCANTTTIQISTNPNPTLTIVPTSTNICRGDQVSLTVNGAVGYSWTTVGITSNTNAATITESPTTNVVYIVTGTNNFNCTSTAQQVVVVRPTPTLQIGTTKPLVCEGAPSSMTVTSSAGAGVSPCTYVWSTNAGAATTSVVTVNPLVSTSYTAVGLAPNGCTSTVNYPISVFLPTFAVNSPTQSCQGGTVILTATGANTYTWNGNQPFQSIPVSPPGPTVYIVAATSNSSGVNCISTKSVQVTIYNNPTVTAVATRTQVCKTESTTISGGGASTYTLNTGDTGTLIGVYPVGNATTYTLTGTDQNGCIGTATIQIKTSICFGIDEQALANRVGLKMYPNPSNGNFVISATDNVNVRLENELGQLIAIYELNAENQHKVLVEGLTSGVYFVTLDKDAERSTQKVVITK